ncbi:MULTISPECIES: MATE family efflux transporter [Mesonia]|uniref:DNA damage-inducible protein F n=1 Tax=Mesonia oceanica TaxID=2687242 RepID=A0AC61Y341_9FLAO|nr:MULTISPECIES: MATE family efflux transporter [Mesonia]MAN28624.1 MATE family efflux transporter [Mesonia sp.]MAQ41305.1 MATE family efflux transporter [Mesonia sp.]MBJ97404.1 MATE family efflux transporter [Flavobacteriaceae bacterium]VVU98878.1 DNA damage-inducible protein F [Mesonia oceanica]|tara:strand:+ start:55334 stop:56662 length:1329 start_codon:yes stop_codon:yes gene_type:complete
MATTPKVSFKEINKIAIPAIIAGIAEPLISLTDIAVIGNIRENSVEALAAAGIVGSFLSAIIWIVAQTKTAISAIVSQHLGANRVHAVKTLIPQAIIFNLILSLVIYATTAFFAESIFSAYNAEGLILTYTEDYYTIRAMGYPLTLVTFAIFGVFRGLQNTLWAMKCSLAGAAVNIGLDYVLVYGIEGFIPPLHLKGAAYASLAAQATMLMMAFYFFFKKTPFHLKLSFNLNPQMKPLLVMAANLFVRTAALNFAIYLANAYATDYGKNYIAAQSILMNIWLFFSFFIDGYANAGNAIGGRLLGAKDYVRLWNLSKDICKYAVFIALILVAICGLFYNEIGLIFNKEATVLALFSSVFWLVLLMQPINAIAFMFDGIFKGLGEAKYLRNVLLAATFLGFTPTLLIADYFGLKLYAIWLGFLVWMLIRSSTLVIKFRRKYLKN